MARAAVIGGGFGGIAAALRLRAKGHDVTLVDRCPRLGGRAQVFEKDGFRHDAGPTVLTAPFLFDELFALFGRQRADYVELRELDLWYRFHFHDGSSFDYGGTTDDTIREIAKISPRDADGYKKLLRHSERIFDVGFTRLADQPFHSPITLAAQVPNMIKLGCYRTVWQLVAKYLRDERLRRAFSIHPLLVGGNPFETTCIYSLKAIHTQGRRAEAVETEDGASLPVDFAVSNADPLHLYQNTIRTESQHTIFRAKRKRMRQSMGLFVLFFGSAKQYPELAHHTIWLGIRFRELIHEIFHGKRLPEDFSLYIHRPTATDPSFAPEGCDSFYVLAPVPNLQAPIDWAAEGPALRDRIVRALDRTIMPDLEANIRSDFFMTPEDFARDYLSTKGSGFSVAPVFSQSAWFRFHNRSEMLDNLYLVGAGTHPGAGVPGVLCSAKVIDRLIEPAA